MAPRIQTTLKDVLQVKGYVRGPFGSALKRNDMLSAGIPVYEQQHAIYDSRVFRFFIDAKKHQEMQRFTVQENDLIISCSGTVGKVSKIKANDPTGIISQALLLLRVNPQIINPDYLKYFFLSEEGYNAIVSRSSGSVQVNIAKREVIEQIPLRLPTLDEQQKIVQILGSLDDKIELNRRVNANLEEQATAIYAKFFPYETTDALPEGWRVGTVGEIVEIHDSKRVPLSAAERMKMENKKFPYYGAASLMDYVEDYIFDGKYLLLGEDGTVVDAKGGPILQYVWGKFWVNNHAHVLTGKLGFNVESLMLLFKQTYVKPIVTGAVQLKISQANLRSLPIIVPPMERLNDFNDKVASLFTQYRVNEEQNKVLTTVRNALLPRLMSGEINVSDVSL